MSLYSESRLVKEMRAIYHRRLCKIIAESSIYDSQGNIIIRPGLKVRHKASQYEYTVAKLTKDPKTGEVNIHLRSPESPRFEPQDETFLGEDDVTKALLDTINSIGADARLEDPEFEVLVVNEKDFEKDYEVK